MEDTASSAYAVADGEEILENVQEYKILSVDPLVRCRECKYWKSLTDVEGLMFCQYVIGAEFVRNKEDYCSRGERKG